MLSSIVAEGLFWGASYLTDPICYAHESYRRLYRVTRGRLKKLVSYDRI
jgi:hypothetical protein